MKLEDLNRFYDSGKSTPPQFGKLAESGGGGGAIYVHHTFLEIPNFACFNVQFLSRDPEEFTSENYIEKLTELYAPVAEKMIESGVEAGEFALSGYAYIYQGDSLTPKYSDTWEDSSGATKFAFLSDEYNDIKQTVNDSVVIGRAAISFTSAGGLSIKGYADTADVTSGDIRSYSSTGRSEIPFDSIATKNCKVFDVVY